VNEADFAQGLDELLKVCGRPVTLVTDGGEIEVQALVDDGLDEYGIDEIVVVVPPGEWSEDDVRSIVLGGVTYEVAGAKRNFGDVTFRLGGVK